MNYAEEIMQNLLMIMPLMQKNFVKGFTNESDLITSHMQIMGMIKMNGPTSMKEISYFLGISAPNLTVLVEKIVEKGYIERVSSHLDRRIIKLVLTDKGDEFLEQQKSVMIKQLDAKMAVLSQEDKKYFLESIKTINQILSKIK
jgi:MarR family transcriptional regulator, organic hydroperoxide resistance regulator